MPDAPPVMSAWDEARKTDIFGVFGWRYLLSSLQSEIVDVRSGYEEQLATAAVEDAEVDDVAPFYYICKPRFISGSPGVQLDGND
jgi:hypothetical protein